MSGRLFHFSGLCSIASKVRCANPPWANEGASMPLFFANCRFRTHCNAIAANRPGSNSKRNVRIKANGF